PRLTAMFHFLCVAFLNRKARATILSASASPTPKWRCPAQRKISSSKMGRRETLGQIDYRNDKEGAQLVPCGAVDRATEDGGEFWPSHSSSRGREPMLGGCRQWGSPCLEPHEWRRDGNGRD